MTGKYRHETWAGRIMNPWFPSCLHTVRLVSCIEHIEQADWLETVRRSANERWVSRQRMSQSSDLSEGWSHSYWILGRPCRRCTVEYSVPSFLQKLLRQVIEEMLFENESVFLLPRINTESILYRAYSYSRWIFCALFLAILADNISGRRWRPPFKSNISPMWQLSTDYIIFMAG